MRARQAIIGVVAALGATALALPSGSSASPTQDPAERPTSLTADTVVSDEGLDGLTPATDAPPPAELIEGGSAERGSPIQLTPTLPPPPSTTTTTTTTTVAPTWPPVNPAALPWLSGTGRRVVYSLSAMRVWAVEADGTVVKTHRVSGKRGVPNPGTYSVWSRSLRTSNIDNPAVKWMYMIRFAKGPGGGNIGFHEIPTQCRTWLSNSIGRDCWKLQSEAQLGQALSGGCIRQSTPDALWLWNWAGLGTRVVVLP